MNYLKSALALKQLINESNKQFLNLIKENKQTVNYMLLSHENGEINTISMQEYTNDFVQKTLQNYNKTNAFAITDLAAQAVQGKKIYYLMYKAYHRQVEKGLVFYQLINPKTLAPEGDLKFSALEDNIFYEVASPDFEESSCNAMETGEQSIELKNIVFLIGHTSEERLSYDVERLIFDTLNNIQKNPNVQFNFIIHLSVFGGKPSDAFREKIKKIETFTKTELLKEYKNTKLTFEWDD